MRTILFAVLLVVLSILVDSTARIIAAQAEGKATAIITDGDHEIVRVMLGGKEIARFTAHGLHVRDDIEYGGTITDTGTAYFDHRAGGYGEP